MTLRVLYDVDGVLADLIGGLCKACSFKIAEPDNVTAYNFEDCMPKEVVGEWRSVMLDPGFALSLEPYRGARELVQVALDCGYEVVYVTMPYRASKTWAYDRCEWLDKHMPKAPIVLTGHKHLVTGDQLIEDNPENLAKWLEHHPRGMGVLVDRPWNQDIGGLKYTQPDRWYRRPGPST